VSGRVLCFGNFDLVGVILAYVDGGAPPRAGDFLPVPVPGFNPPTAEVGRQVQAHLLELLAAGTIRPIVGRTVPFEGLAKALDDMESRTTIGRIVVTR
jgi:NADPH:quinone reductase